MKGVFFEKKIYLIKDLWATNNYVGGQKDPSDSICSREFMYLTVHIIYATVQYIGQYIAESIA